MQKFATRHGFWVGVDNILPAEFRAQFVTCGSGCSVVRILHLEQNKENKSATWTKFKTAEKKLRKKRKKKTCSKIPKLPGIASGSHSSAAFQKCDIIEKNILLRWVQLVLATNGWLQFCYSCPSWTLSPRIRVFQDSCKQAEYANLRADFIEA